VRENLARLGCYPQLAFGRLRCAEPDPQLSGGEVNIAFLDAFDFVRMP
jgi:hypothetical protein